MMRRDRTEPGVAIPPFFSENRDLLTRRPETEKTPALRKNVLCPLCRFDEVFVKAKSTREGKTRPIRRGTTNGKKPGPGRFRPGPGEINEQASRIRPFVASVSSLESFA